MLLKENKKKYTNEVNINGAISKENKVVDVDNESSTLTLTLETKQTIKGFDGKLETQVTEHKVKITGKRWAMPLLSNRFKKNDKVGLVGSLNQDGTISAMKDDVKVANRTDTNVNTCYLTGFVFNEPKIVEGKSKDTLLFTLLIPDFNNNQSKKFKVIRHAKKGSLTYLKEKVKKGSHLSLKGNLKNNPNYVAGGINPPIILDCTLGIINK